MTIVRWISAPLRMKGLVTGVAPMPSTRVAVGSAIQEIHDLHADFVWRSLQRLGVRDRDLEDQLQEVFIVAHRRLASFNGSSELTTWLFGICLRVAAAHRRRAHVRSELATFDGELPESGAGKDPEKSALEREAREELEALLSGLDLEKRAVFVMFEIEGFTAPEIAEVMGTPIGTVYSRLAAARGELEKAARRRRGSGRLP